MYKKQRLERLCRFHRITDFRVSNVFFTFWCGKAHFRTMISWYEIHGRTAEGSGIVTDPEEFRGHEIHIDITSDFTEGYFTFMSAADIDSGEIAMIITGRPRGKVDCIHGHIKKITPRFFEAVSAEGHLLLNRGYASSWGPHLYQGTILGTGPANIYV